jgi:hypothetical protein
MTMIREIYDNRHNNSAENSFEDDSSGASPANVHPHASLAYVDDLEEEKEYKLPGGTMV